VKRFGEGYIDYYQGVQASRRGPYYSFGIRVETNRAVAVIKIADGQAFTFGEHYPLPLTLGSLPTYLRIALARHLQQSPTSDILDLLIGAKVFGEAFRSTRSKADNAKATSA